MCLNYVFLRNSRRLATRQHTDGGCYDQNSDVFPTSSQSIGITGKLPKTAALMFDRVVTYGIEPCPAPIGWVVTFGQEGGRKKKFRFILDGGKVSLIEDRDSEQPTLYKVPNVDAALGANHSR